MSVPPGESKQVKELRLALVCYGGVSLAIYMHGLTQELHRLVIASTPERGVEPGSTEAIYRELLDKLEGRDDARTRVVIDIISGTSAGGINGVSLARALAMDGALDPVRDLWMNGADIEKLVREEWKDLIADIWPEIEDAWPLIARRFPALAKLSIPGVKIDKKRGLLARTRSLIRLGRRGPKDAAKVAKTASALQGDSFSRLLEDGLRLITAGNPGGTLMPPGHRLDLFVTMTDLHGYVQHVPLGDEYVSEHAYRHFNTFTRDSAATPSNDFTDDFVDMLAFSGRASSSFPGAFEPVGLDAFASDLQKGTPPRAITWQQEQVLRFFRTYALRWAEVAGQPQVDPAEAVSDIAKRTFVDGGVLDNYPFDHAIDAIRKRPADHETRRALLYLEPDPMRRPENEREVAAAGTSIASMFSALKAAAKDIPLEQPILEQIQQLEAMNDAARRLHQIIVAADPSSGLIEGESLSGEPQNVAYKAFRVDSVAQGLANSIGKLRRFPEDSNQAVATRVVVDKWVAANVPLTLSSGGTLNPAVDQFLGSFDFGYQRRRLRFLVDGVISLYPGNARRDGVPLDLPTRSQLDAAKQLLYAGIAVIDGTYDVVGQNAAILAGVLELFPDTISNTILGPPDWPPRGKLKQEAIASLIADDQFGALIRSVRQQLSDALPGDPPKPSFDAYSESVFDDLVELIGGAESGDPPGWPDPAWHEDRFRSRFDFFERWDRVVYPIQRAFQVGEHDVVTLARMSPLDATLLAPPGGDPEERDSFYKNKLKGTRFNHFGAFLEPAWRQGDYLWGRLDAAERLVRLLVNDPKDSETVTSFCNRLFPAILSEEEPVLREATDVIELVSSRLPLA